jgi:hypothetical protein
MMPLVEVDWTKAREEYRDALEAHAKAKNRLKRNVEKVEELLLAVLDAHKNATLSDPELLTKLGTLLVKREDLTEKVESTKAALKAATEMYGAQLQEEPDLEALE